ncbi:Pao retrotransposon peptidase superfamily, partial [Trichinella spiralis]|uniref:Pao retrotransposon peptidase superfamily n=1 Tax=Trichinella spiralis TaxID=6334 RepID=UPI0001EFEB45
LVRLWLSPVSGEHAGERYELEAMTAPVLCEDLWQTPVSPEDWPHLQNLNLTREVGELTPVHVIIGLDSYFRFLGRQVIRGGDGDPVAVETRFGWIICGPAALSREREYRVHCIRTDDSLNAALRKFWELEAIGILPPETESGQTEMERRFKESLSFDGNRYSVGLLWKPGMANLPNNYATAIRRYRSLEKRLSRDSGLDEDYTTVMQSYFDNGWAEEAPASKTPGKTWCLPHHAVYQQGTTGRKCRIVFDGSAVHRGTSLNDQLESGPNLHVDLMGILLRFRRFRVGLHPEDRDACRFLWRGARGGKAPREYRLTRVCFGLTCSPFLAIQTIRTHAEKSQHAGDKTARLITSNMYVDDLVLSCDSIEVAKKLVQESKSLFGKGGFNLTGFVSNCSSVVGYDGALPFGKDPKPAGRLWKTLGVLWDTKSDQLSFRQLKIDAEAQDTKRTLLSLAATIFDPLGYLTPFTVRAKMLLQLLWQEGTSWDDPLPVPVAAVWRNWKGELADLSQVSIDRACIQCSLMEVAYMDLHGFADASGSAYGAVVYLRLMHGNGKVEVRFIAAKSRVAPIKKLGLPSSTLCSLGFLCETGSRLTDQELLLLERQFSGPVLDTKRRAAMEAEIISPDSWRYCPTQDNPADLASRGCPLSKLAAGSLWHLGPRWLQLDEGAWPRLKIGHGKTPENMALESRKTALVMTASVKFDLWSVMDVARYSSYGRLVRVTAWCLRFIFNARLPMELRRKARGLTVPELREAEKTWIRQVQVSAYGPGSHRRKDLQQFNPYLDEAGILRVGGRLAFSELPRETRNPMLLPHGDGVVKLLIQQVHEQQLHAGIDQTLAATRKRFWITTGRSA